MTETQDLIVVGKIVGIFGVRGWVKVFSHTAPKEGIFSYDPWHLRIADRWRPMKVLAHQRHGKALVAQLEGYDDREVARTLMGCEVAIQRRQLPPAERGEFYWADLVGMKVVTTEGIDLGRVEYLLETGANDVLVVTGDRERLIPFVQAQYILNVDLASGVIQVDWDPDF